MTSKNQNIEEDTCTIEDDVFMILHVNEEGKSVVHLLDKITNHQENLFCKHNLPSVIECLQKRYPEEVQSFRFCKIVELSVMDINQLILEQAIRDKDEETIQ